MDQVESDAPSFRLGMLSLACVPLFVVVHCAWASLAFDPAVYNLDFGSGLLTDTLYFGAPAIIPMIGVVLGIQALRHNEPRPVLTNISLGLNGTFLAGSCFFFLLGIGLGGI